MLAAAGLKAPQPQRWTCVIPERIRTATIAYGTAALTVVLELLEFDPTGGGGFGFRWAV